jgi:hypothetical protein
VRPSSSEANVPRHCSGEAYVGVSISPRVLNVAELSFIATIPKSSIFGTSPPWASRASRMFSGLMSRCTMLSACAAASPSATPRAIARARSMGNGAWVAFNRCRRLTPST